MAWLRPSARAPPPAFLFPIQRCQRPRPAPPAPLFSAGGRRRRLSTGPPRSRQPDFSVFFRELRDQLETLEMVDAQTVPTPANPRKPRSSEVRPGGVPVQGGGYLEGRPVLVNPAFSASFRRPPEEPENIRKRIDPRPLRHRQTQVIQGISSVRPAATRPRRRLSRPLP